MKIVKSIALTEDLDKLIEKYRAKNRPVLNYSAAIRVLLYKGLGRKEK